MCITHPQPQHSSSRIDTDEYLGKVILLKGGGGTKQRRQVRVVSGMEESRLLVSCFGK